MKEVPYNFRDVRIATLALLPERNILPEIELTDAELNEDQQAGERPLGHRQA